jgi:hypothetical protein
MLGKAGMTSEKLLKAARKVKETFGTDPKDPWSAKAGIQESSIDNYLLAKGQNPKYVDQQKKAALARSHEYQNWASTRTKQEEIDPSVKTTDMLRGRIKGGKKDDVGPGADFKSTKVKYHPGPMSEDENLDEEVTDETHPWEVYHRKQERVVGRYKTHKAASRAVDRHDNAYGGYVAVARNVNDRKKTNEGKDPNMDAGCGSQSDFVSNANTSNSPSDKKLNTKLKKEEVEELDELSKNTLGSYIKKASKSVRTRAAFNAAAPGSAKSPEGRIKGIAKATDKLTKESNYEWSGAGGMYETDAVKQHYSLIDKYLMSKGINPKYVDQQKKAAEARTDAFRKWKEHALQTQKESVLHDEPEGTLTRVSEKSRAFKLIKSIVKGHKKSMSEEMYDKDKEEKEPARVYGKAPKLEKPDDKEKSKSENKPQAAATLSGGRTLTGQDRDVVELDPMMRNRPGQPDITKGKDKDKDKDKKDDKKSDKK